MTRHLKKKKRKKGEICIAFLTFLPYRHWKKMTPTDHTSTLLEIFGGSFPTTKHSGGKYLAGFLKEV